MVQRDRNRESVRKTHDNVKARNKKNSLYKYPRTDYAPRLIKKKHSSTHAIGRTAMHVHTSRTQTHEFALKPKTKFTHTTTEMQRETPMTK